MRVRVCNPGQPVFAPFGTFATNVQWEYQSCVGVSSFFFFFFFSSSIDEISNYGKSFDLGCVCYGESFSVRCFRDGFEISVAPWDLIPNTRSLFSLPACRRLPTGPEPLGRVNERCYGRARTGFGSRAVRRTW